MSYVFYDVETTGLSRQFDQIIDFAAIRTDHQLNEIERFQVRSRLRPHVVPHPEAMRVNRTSIAELMDPSRGSHYDMVFAIRERLLAWSPAIFVGFNSIQFDEELLRQALYQCLHSPYLTSRSGCGRADAMNLALDASFSSPGSIVVPRNSEGRLSYRLSDLALANGLKDRPAHSASGDVETTLDLCRCLKKSAPEAWQRFVRFSSKSSVASFVQSEDAFVLTRFVGHQAQSVPLVWVCNDPGQSAVAFCLKVDRETHALLDATEEEIAAAFELDPSLFVRLRTNKAPALSSLYDAEDGGVEFSLPVDEIEDLARAIRERSDFCARVSSVISDLTPPWPVACYVEQKIYESFWSREDDQIMAKFHQVPWTERLAVLELLSDERSKLLGLRLVNEMRPDLLMPSHHAMLAKESSLRTPDSDRPLGRARATELAAALVSQVGVDEVADLMNYLDHLRECSFA